MKKLFKNKYFIILIALFFIFLPTAIVQDSESESDAIVTAIGVDYLQDEGDVEVSLQIIVPTPAEQFSQQLSVISTKSTSVSSAMSDLSLRLGKHISFPHCKVIAFNDALAEGGLQDDLDYIIRNKANGNNIVLLKTSDSAKELLQNISDIDHSLYFSLNNSGGFNKEYLDGRQLNLGNFYKSYLTKDGSCIVGNVSLEKADEVGMISIPNTNQQNASQESKKPQKTVVNKGESSLYKNGKKIKDLTKEETMGFNFFNKDTKKGFIYVEGVNDDIYHNAKVGVFIEQKSTRQKVSFDNDKPVYKLSLDLYIRVAQIIEPDKTYDIYNEDRVFLSPALKAKLKEKITQTIKSAITISIENNADVLRIGREFEKYHNKQYKQYRKQNAQNPHKNITFEYDINIKERL